jgi:hypothetical protein
MNDITTELIDIPAIKNLINQGYELGSKEFVERAQLYFHPEYAEQFFAENENKKLAIK